MNMFKATKAKTVKEYIDALPPERQALVRAVDKLIRETVPGLKPYFATNMLGYGTFPYLNSKKQWIDWQVIGLASQKEYVSLFVCAIDGKQYAAEKYKDELGNAKVGKSCISFKKLEDLNIATLKKVLKYAEKHPGLQSAAQKKK